MSDGGDDDCDDGVHDFDGGADDNIRPPIEPWGRHRLQDMRPPREPRSPRLQTMRAPIPNQATSDGNAIHRSPRVSPAISHCKPCDCRLTWFSVAIHDGDDDDHDDNDDEVVDDDDDFRLQSMQLRMQIMYSPHAKTMVPMWFIDMYHIGQVSAVQYFMKCVPI